MDLGAVNKIDDALGFARVTAVEPGESRVKFTRKDETKPNPQLSYKALVVSQPLPPVLVTMQGDDEGLKLVREALQSAGPGGQPSLIVREVTEKDIAAAAQRAGGEVKQERLAVLALGARDGQIRWLFLVESGLIGLIGSLVGWLLGWGVARILSLIVQRLLVSQGNPPLEFFTMTPGLAAAAIGFGVLISLASGLLPAARAARVDPVRALRRE